MSKHDTAEGYRIAPLDDRDEDDPHWSIDPVFSSPDFDFSSEDPAVEGPEPREEIAPAWNHEERDIEA